MAKEIGLQKLKHLSAYINMIPGPGRTHKIQALLLNLKRYIEGLEKSTTNVDVAELDRLNKQIKTLQLSNTDKDIRILDLEESQEALGSDLRETKQNLANERRRTTRLTKRIEDIEPKNES
jgi:hypothetical protein